MPYQLVERVEVAARPLDELERLGHLAHGAHGRVVESCAALRHVVRFIRHTEGIPAAGGFDNPRGGGALRRRERRGGNRVVRSPR